MRSIFITKRVSYPKGIFTFAALLTVLLTISTHIFANEPDKAKEKPVDFSAQYSEAGYRTQHHHEIVRVLTIGNGKDRAYAFIPEGPLPEGHIPIVFFHHGWLGTSPKNFGALIDHLVRSGSVVIYPVYQTINSRNPAENTQPREITQLAGNADKRALEAVEASYPNLVDPEKVLYVGYSMGSAISLNIALDPSKFGLPPPKALVLMAPGNAHHVARGDEGKNIIGDLSGLPKDLAVVLIGGSADKSIGLPTSRELASQICHIPKSHRTLLIYSSDSDGNKKVLAGHGSPGAPDSRYEFPNPNESVAELIMPAPSYEASGSLNMLDFAGYWKVTTSMLTYVNSGIYPKDVFGTGDAVKFLGKWPSGRPYIPAEVEDPCPE